MKKLFTLFFALVASAGMIFAETFTGQCGDNITWSLNTDDGALVINGTGPMYDYSYQDTPWYNKSIDRGGWWEIIAKLIRTITISDGITSIGSYAFSYGSSLSSISIPNSVTIIGRSAFEFCSSLSSIEIPNSVTNIGYRAFEYCGLTDVYISDLSAWCRIEGGRELFFNCPSHHLYLNNEEIIDLVIPNGTTTIGAGVFSNCFISAVTIPNSVTSIGNRVFEYCTGLTSVTCLGETPASISSDTFEEASSLSAIYVPCGTLETYQTSAGWSNYASQIKYSPYPSYTINKNAENGYISTTTTEFTICDEPLVTCTAIPNRGFYFVRWADGNTDNPRIIELTQDTTMEAIFDYLLEGKCGKDSALVWKLDTTTMNLEITGKAALSENYTYGTFIESLTIGNEVTSIGQSAFYGCRNLKNIILGSSVKVLEECAFCDCPAIETITCYSQRPPTVNQYALYGLDYSTIVYVPADYLETYKMHDAWGLYDVRPLGATSAETDDIKITPSETTAEVVWPAVSGAAIYELVVKDKNGNVICTLVFNANGQLTSIAFNAPARNNAPQQTHSTGFSFTVTGLESGTGYDLTMTATDTNGTTLQENTMSFYTTGGEQGVEEVKNDHSHNTKVIRDGQIFILRGDKTYTITGAEVK